MAKKGEDVNSFFNFFCIISLFDGFLSKNGAFCKKKGVKRGEFGVEKEKK